MPHLRSPSRLVWARTSAVCDYLLSLITTPPHTNANGASLALGKSDARANYELGIDGCGNDDPRSVLKLLETRSRYLGHRIAPFGDKRQVT